MKVSQTLGQPKQSVSHALCACGAESLHLNLTDQLHVRSHLNTEIWILLMWFDLFMYSDWYRTTQIEYMYMQTFQKEHVLLTGNTVNTK